MVHGLLHDAPPYEVLSAAGVCVAGMAAMKYAYHAVRTESEHRRAVACAAEAASAIMRKEAFQPEIDVKKLADAKPDIAFEKDFLRWMLSDGAGAVCLSNAPLSDGPSFKVHWIELVSYANEMPPCMYAGGQMQTACSAAGKRTGKPIVERLDSPMSIKQDVKLLNEHIIHYTVEKALHRARARHPSNAEEVAWFLPHYSSGYFRDKVYVGLKNAGFELGFEKWFTNLPEKGNTGSASIYIMLDEFIRSGRAQKG